MNAPGTILVHEYVTGGGWPGRPGSPGLAGLGATILRAVLSDMRALGPARLITTTDARLPLPDLEADIIVRLTPDSHATGFAALAAAAEMVLVVAPEEGGILAGLSQTALAAGARLLGSLPQGVRAAGDKWACHQLLRKAGLPLPEAVPAAPGQAGRAARDLGFPLVAKLVDGQGGGGVCLARDAAELEAALALLGEDVPLVLERYHDGTHASVSVMAAASGAVPLCLNGQDIRPGIPFAYRGGVTPLAHPEAAAALSLAVEAVRAIPGLRGFVGVDMVLDGEGCRIIEVNPRVTVAYAGVRQVLATNLAQVILQACLDDRLPAGLETRGRVAFGPREAS
ncbi:MAG: ATP-grasp domain-containing protein [Solidesulfovibrio sp. DCME]|uniref:ATP-grasp domain-containing protein n=1 Tax=Solidesulfovibrio sp. DCME TaxID=3447380 RepID=UPI003D12B58D